MAKYRVKKTIHSFGYNRITYRANDEVDVPESLAKQIPYILEKVKEPVPEKPAVVESVVEKAVPPTAREQREALKEYAQMEKDADEKLAHEKKITIAADLESKKAQTKSARG